MILHGNQRGGARDLAFHLLKDENEHVEIHELRGFASDTLMGALNESYAISRGTRCKQFLYSLSLNPPQDENVETTVFEAAIESVEKELGLDGQPRAIVFHEKEGRRHAHVVWSRIDIQEMKAVHLAFDREKLNGLSRELYLEHGWKMPDGLADKSLRNPTNFTLAEWQQAKRAGKDPRAIKTAFQDAWAISDLKAAFVHAMDERGYKVARGDRRGFVAVDVHGEVYSVPKQAGVRTKAVRDRLGDENDLPSVDSVKAQFATQMLNKVSDFEKEAERDAEKQKADFENQRIALVNRQRMERLRLLKTHAQRRILENQQRQDRFRKGLKGLWDRLRGEHARIREQNLQEAALAKQRDTQERDALVFRHIKQRQNLNVLKQQVVLDLKKQHQELAQDRQRFQAMAGPEM